MLNNLPLVRSLTHRFQVRSADREDLFQQGCIGLMMAVDRFDSTLGYAFSSYAVPYILGEMHGLCRKAWSIPRTRFHECTDERKRRKQTGTPLPLCVSLDEYEKAEQVMSASCFRDHAWLDRLMLFDLVQRLSTGEQMLFSLRYLDGATQQMTGTMMHLSQAQVSRMESALRCKLYHLWQ